MNMFDDRDVSLEILRLFCFFEREAKIYTVGVAAPFLLHILSSAQWDKPGVRPLFACMMTSSNEDIIRVTDPLWWVESPHKQQWRGSLMLSLIYA